MKNEFVSVKNTLYDKLSSEIGNENNILVNSNELLNKYINIKVIIPYSMRNIASITFTQDVLQFI